MSEISRAGLRRIAAITGCLTLVASACAADGGADLGAGAGGLRAAPAASARTNGTAQPTVTTPSTLPAITATTEPSKTVEPVATTTSTTTVVPRLVDVEPCAARLTVRRTIGQLAADLDADETDLWFENGRRDVVDAGTVVDICPGNGRADVDGADVDQASLDAALSANVRRQQERLNDLLAGTGLAPLDVDGVSGPRTAQRLCAVRVMLGLDASIGDMRPGTIEQALLFAIDELPVPESSALNTDRWALIDLTCQVMFVGEGDELVFVFPTSTGSDGFETRPQDRSEVFRFNPAIDNGGWHDSTEYPVGVDNPLNGNLYKPLYFDLGQAIHGATNVPPTPASKGCARLTVQDHDTLVAWLGLDDVQGELWRADEINFVVNVQGDFVPRR